MFREIVLIVDEIVAFPTGGDQKSEIKQGRDINAPFMKPGTADPVSSDVPQGQ